MPTIEWCITCAKNVVSGISVFMITGQQLFFPMKKSCDQYKIKKQQREKNDESDRLDFIFL
jgi:hypothetical protein